MLKCRQKRNQFQKRFAKKLRRKGKPMGVISVSRLKPLALER